jgi:hypothetical protein
MKLTTEQLPIVRLVCDMAIPQLQAPELQQAEALLFEVEQQMTEFDDSPVFTWDDITDWIRGFFAAIGLMFLALLAGLYQSGFFQWAAGKFPGGVIAFFFGGAL